MFGDRPPSTTAALRSLLVVVFVVIGIFIYSYGWTITDISLENPQEPTRLASLSRTMRELLSPNIFEQDTETELVSMNFKATRDCPEEIVFRLLLMMELEQPIVEQGAPYITVSAVCGFSDDILVVEGFNFDYHPRNSGIIRWRLPNNTIPVTRFELDSDGHFREEFEIPKLGRVTGNNIHQIESESFTPKKIDLIEFIETGKTSIRLTETTKIVFEKMIETIFLALMATSLALPISIALSFLAARNLMRQLSMPLGPVLVGFIFFPIGWWLGASLLGTIGEFGRDSWQNIDEFADMGQAFLTLVVSGVLAGTIIGLNSLKSMVASPNSNKHEREVSDASSTIVQTVIQLSLRIIQNIVMLMLIILVVGILGGIAMWLGREVQAWGLFKDVGNMTATIGELVGLIITLIGGILGAFYLASVSSSLTAPAIKVTRNIPIVAHSLGAILGATVVGMILYGLAELSHQAALVILLVPLAAAFIGGQILPMIYHVAFPGDKYVKPQGMEKRFLQGLALIGAILIFVIAFQMMNTQRGIIDGRRPLIEEIDVWFFSMKIYSFRAFLLGVGLGGIMGGLAGVNASFPFGMVVYNTTRTILNTLRSIEPLIMGIVFVIWVGIGPFAGMLALALHSVASLGKLYSEQVENIDEGPIEAVLATGANRLQMIIYAVVPQIVPPYIAFTMYRWDINVRMSTIIGFVGGGGIGFLLSQQINQLRYQQAGVAVLAIAIVVTVLDYTSAYIREKMI